MSDLPTIMACVYGKPKKRKTSDALASFPRALFIGVPSAIMLVAQNELGFTPAVHPAPPQTLEDLFTILGQIYQEGLGPQYGAVVIDDTSHLCKRSMLKWEMEAPTGRSGKKDRFYPYTMLNKALLRISGLARHLGCHLVMTFHEKAPSTDSFGNFAPGGPEVPSRKQVETLPSWADINVRAMIDPNYPDPWFPSIYSVDPTDPEWVTGDRTGVCSKKTPANLREILRASQSGYRLERLPDLEWQDDLAQVVADRLAAGEDVKAIVSAVTAGREENPLHLRWACQDGIARGVLQQQTSRSLFDFGAKEIAETSGSNGPSLPPPPPTK